MTIDNQCGFQFPDEFQLKFVHSFHTAAKRQKKETKKKNRIPSCQSHTHFFVYKKKKNPGNVRIREKMKIQSSQKEEHKNFPFF